IRPYDLQMIVIVDFIRVVTRGLIPLRSRDSVATFYFCREPDNIPIRKANTAVACGTADKVGVIGSMDADPFFIERNPYHSDRIIRTARNQMEITAAFAVLKHFLVPTKRRHLRNSAYFPLADRRCGVSGTD